MTVGLAVKCATHTLTNKHTEHVLRFVPVVCTHTYGVQVTQMLRSTDRSSTRARATACAVTVDLHSERCPVLRLPTFSLQTHCNPGSAPTCTLQLATHVHSFLHSHGEGQSTVHYLFVLHASAVQLANRMSSVATKPRGIHLSSWAACVLIRFI